MSESHKKALETFEQICADRGLCDNEKGLLFKLRLLYIWIFSKLEQPYTDLYFRWLGDKGERNTSVTSETIAEGDKIQGYVRRVAKVEEIKPEELAKVENQ